MVVPCLAESGPEYVATRFQLEYLRAGEWKPVSGGRRRDNRRRRILFALDQPVTAKAGRLAVAAQSDDGKGNYRACCRESAVNPP